MNNIKVATLNVKIKNFFFRYIEFLKPFHKLNPQQSQVLALLLYYHYKLSKEITNNKVLWKEVFDYDTKQLIIDELNISVAQIQNIFTQLRKKNVIIDNRISELYIPTLKDKSKIFTITFNFNISYDE